MATCTITGTVKNLAGQPLKGELLRIIHVNKPLLDGSIYLGQEKIEVFSDSDGLFSFALLQGVQFRAELTNNMYNLSRLCTVPEAESADLFDIIFPRFTNLDFSDEMEDMEVEDTQDILVIGTLSDGTTMNISTAYLTFESSDEDVVEIDSHSLKALSAGSSTITIASFDYEEYEIIENISEEPISRINRADIVYGDITITVT